MSQSLLNKTLVVLICFVTNRLRFFFPLSFNVDAWYRDLFLKDAASVLVFRRSTGRSPTRLPVSISSIPWEVGQERTTASLISLKFNSSGGKEKKETKKEVLRLALKLLSCPRT